MFGIMFILLIALIITSKAKFHLMDLEIKNKNKRISNLRKVITAHMETKWFNPLTNQWQMTICNYSSQKALDIDEGIKRDDNDKS